MARRSARIASSQGSQQSSPVAAPQSSPASASRKRKAESGSSPSAKRGKKNEKEQTTIEESMDLDTNDDRAPKPEESTQEPKAEVKANESTEKQATMTGKTDTENASKDASKDASEDVSKDVPDDAPKDAQSNGHTENPVSSAEPKEEQRQAQSTESKDSHPEISKDAKDESTGPEESKLDMTDNGKQEEKLSSADANTNGNAVEPSARSGKVPSSILEKGIIYFLYRGRVNLDTVHPTGVEDIARSFFVLRPLPHGAKISDGPIGDDENCRLIAIPKKMLPLSGKDRWTAFVETSNTSFKELKESFMKDSSYETQTGHSNVPAATPFAEGVYAITTTGRESHLAYILTLPEKLGEVQNALGLRQKGSFVTSVKNPKAPSPANTNIGKDPGYSEELQSQFRSLRWAPLKPDHLNYEGCQFLLVGEGEQGLEKATAPQEGDEKKAETAEEEMQKLEQEDEIRVEHLNGTDAVFEDLGTNAKDYPNLMTTW